MKKNIFSKTFALSIVGGSVAIVLISCSSQGHGSPFPIPSIPAAKSALIPPDLTAACPITNSSIDTFKVKGSGLAFNGASFGTVGTYTYYLAESVGKVNINDACASTIVDLPNLAWTADASGNIKYSFDVMMISPTDPTKASGTLLFEVTNRGNDNAVQRLLDTNSDDLFSNTAPGIPASGATAVKGTGSGNAFLMNRGMTIVWSGWQGDISQSLSDAALNGATPAITSTTKWYLPGMTLPIAKDAKNGNSPITGVVQDEFIADAPGSSGSFSLAYSQAPGTAQSLTIQKTALSTPITLDSSLYSVSNGKVTINRAAVVANANYASALDVGSDNGSIYHFNYTAINPQPYGLGFLATRDLISFLRYEKQDGNGNANPISGLSKIALATGNSQSGRYLRDFLWQGFNTSAKIKPVFDGMLPMVAGSRKTYTNFRWAKPGDFSKQHETHFTPGDQFPFAYATITDPLSGKTDGLLQKCSQMNDCPKVIQYDSPVEFSNARASLNVTDGVGNDISIPNNVRMIYVPGTAHGATALADNALSLPDYTTNSKSLAVSSGTFPNALTASTALARALLINLEGWINGSAAPLPSNYPSVKAGTMAVPTTSPTSLNAPDLSALGLPFNGVFNTLTLNDYSVIPSLQSSKQYTVLLPTSDAQGNDIAGVKMPDVAVPLATFKGYNYRASGYVAGDLTSLYGSQLAFNPTKTAKDPRQGFVDLYATKANYLTKWNASVDALIAQGYLLPEDKALYINRGMHQSSQANFSKYLQ